MKRKWLIGLITAALIVATALSALPFLKVEATALIIGAAATDRASSAATNTVIDLTVAANENGTIDTVEVWAASNMTGAKAGIFRLVSGADYICKAVANLGDGTVAAGAKRTFTGLNLPCLIGDFIGMYFDSGTLERDDSGGSNAYKGNDHCVVDDEQTYTTGSRIYSLHGLVGGLPVPTVTAISPDYGTTAGGTSVTITGTNFTGASGGTIGGHAITDFSVVNATSITGTTPADTVKAQDVAVTSAGGTGTLTGGFNYVQAVTNVSTVVEIPDSATTLHSVRIPFQYKIFKAAGADSPYTVRTWLFYELAEYMYFTSWTDGGTPLAGTLIADNYKDFEFASYWDGTHITIVYAKQNANAHLYYRRGHPQSDGSITWDSVAVDAYTPTVGNEIEDPTVCVNTNGYTFVGFAETTNSKCHVLINDAVDGTWNLASDTEVVSGERGVAFAALTAGKVYACCGFVQGESGAPKGKLWDTTWGSEENFGSTTGGYANSFTAVGIGDDVHFAFTHGTTDHIDYCKRTYGVGWAEEVEISNVVDDVDGWSVPNICANGTNLAIFWMDKVKLYVKNCLSGTWDTDPITVADETTNTIQNACFINATPTATSNVFGIVYQISATNPRFVRYASYTQGIPSTITISAASSVEATTATLNGNITATGDENPSVTVYWGTVDHPGTATGWDHNSAPTSPAQPQGVAAFYVSATGLETGTTIYFSAKATNSGGTSWPAASLNFLTKPAAPTDVAATDGSETSKVVVTWTKSTGATAYHVWRGAVDCGALGDVATYDDTGADASVITQGSVVASDGSSTAHVALSLSGTSIANGTTHTYKVVASNATGNSADSSTDTGYRGHGTLSYQWQRSAGDSDETYSDIDGATASTYNDTAAPAPTVTQGTASATDGFYTDKVELSISGASANIGAGRYYQCNLTATGAVNKTATANRGYRGVGSLTYQWKRSDANSDQDYNTNLGTTSTYDDTTAPAPSITKGTATASNGTSLTYVTLSLAGSSANNGVARWYYCVVSATGAASQDTNHNQGYIGVGTLTYQWQRSLADSDADYSNINLATTAPYNDTGGVVDPDGRYYKCVLNATGATQQVTDGDRGYMSASGWTGTVNGVADPAKVMGIDGANVAKVMGQ